MDLNAEHRPLVGGGLIPLRNVSGAVAFHLRQVEEEMMGKGILLWLLGVPIPVIILLWLFFGH
jgi:hypothetical protein